jgi:hypothetical protein
MAPKPTPVAERFWSKVAVAGPDECWDWIGSLEPHGYGQILDHRRLVKAHRVSWEIHNGPVPDRLCVCHHCDNRRCVNPAHLYVGTRKDNNRDRGARKRGRESRDIGELHHNARFTEAEVRAIIAMLEAGYSQGEVGRFFGVRQTTIGRFANRQTWKHLWTE